MEKLLYSCADLELLREMKKLLYGCKVPKNTNLTGTMSVGNSKGTAGTESGAFMKKFPV